jgi:glucan biosynthesis protein C
MKERRHDVDWLRIIAVLAVFLFHCASFFGIEDWHLKVPVDEQQVAVDRLMYFFIVPWFLPLFFMLAGFASWYSLKRRSGGQYLLERSKRLLIPLYTVGLLILAVPQAYFDGVTHGKITRTFWQWLPDYYLNIPGDLLNVKFLDPASFVPFTFAGHLWFIQFLFLISLVTLPLLLYLKSEKGQSLIDKLAGCCARPGGIFLFVIPLAITQVGLKWLPPVGDRTWADFIWFQFFFVAGYIIAADDRFNDSIKRHGWVSLAVWIVGFVIAGLLVLVWGFDLAPGPDFSLLYVLFEITWSITCWGAVIFMLNLGAKALNFSNKVLVYGNEAVMPFYLFHQTIILTVGWFVLPWNMGNTLKFLVITMVSFALTMALYDVFIRRISIMRFLCGMRKKT